MDRIFLWIGWNKGEKKRLSGKDSRFGYSIVALCQPILLATSTGFGGASSSSPMGTTIHLSAAFAGKK